VGKARAIVPAWAFVYQADLIAFCECNHMLIDDRQSVGTIKTSAGAGRKGYPPSRA
jgi:hypothetical protein